MKQLTKIATQPLAVLVVASLGGCMMPAGGAPAHTDKSIDDGSRIATGGTVLADCWIEPGEEADPVFRHDEVVCALDEQNLGHVGASLSTATCGGDGCARRPATEIRHSFSSYADFGNYPMTVEADFLGDAGSPLPSAVRLTATLDGPNATATLAMPADLWVIEIENALIDARYASVRVPVPTHVGDFELNDSAVAQGRVRPSDGRTTFTALVAPGTAGLEASYVVYDAEGNPNEIPFHISGSTTVVATDLGPESSTGAAL